MVVAGVLAILLSRLSSHTGEWDGRLSGQQVFPNVDVKLTSVEAVDVESSSQLGVVALDGVFALGVHVDVSIFVDVAADCPLNTPIREDDGSVQLVRADDLQEQWS